MIYIDQIYQFSLIYIFLIKRPKEVFGNDIEKRKGNDGLYIKYYDIMSWLANL
jgi:hypothetical protein